MSNTVKVTVTSHCSEKYNMSFTKDQIETMLIQKFIEGTKVEILDDIYVKWRTDGSACVIATKVKHDNTITKDIEI